MELENYKSDGNKDNIFLTVAERDSRSTELCVGGVRPGGGGGLFPLCRGKVADGQEWSVVSLVGVLSLSERLTFYNS